MLCGIAARRAGDEETARLELEAARATFDRLGATPDAERASALLAGGAPPAPRGLTTREVEVLRFVARGRSNRDIAVALSISEHTVARHLSNIFRKLDVSSRSAATAFAFQHNLACRASTTTWSFLTMGGLTRICAFVAMPAHAPLPNVRFEQPLERRRRQP